MSCLWKVNRRKTAIPSFVWFRIRRISVCETWFMSLFRPALCFWSWKFFRLFRTSRLWILDLLFEDDMVFGGRIFFSYDRATRHFCWAMSKFPYLCQYHQQSKYMLHKKWIFYDTNWKIYHLRCDEKFFLDVLCFVSKSCSNQNLNKNWRQHINFWMLVYLKNWAFFIKVTQFAKRTASKFPKFIIPQWRNPKFTLTNNYRL